MQKSIINNNNNKTYNYILLSLLLLFNILILNNNSYANNIYCITKDEKGNIIYNKNSKKKCKLIKVIDSTKKNILTEKGEQNINGKPCVLTSSDNYANAEDLNGVTISNGTTRTVRCNTGYEGDIVLRCTDGVITNEGEDNGCYRVAEVEFMSPRNGKGITKTFKDGESILCNGSTFDLEDPDVGVSKVCKVNGYIVAKDGETFTVDINVGTNKYCHGSTIPYDLTGNANATVNITTWSGVTANKDTFRTTVEPINGIAQQSKSDSGNEATNGTWKLGSGYHNMVTVGAHSFVVINGAKKSNKRFTIELWGGSGAGSGGGRGGYTKLVSQLGNKFNEGTVLYVGVGGRANRKRGGYNGGGSTTGGNDWACGGGGATHLATKSGILSSLSGSKSSVIAVAGGGGGDSYKVAGGYGGGGNNDGGDGQGVHGGNAYNTAKGTYCSRGVHSNGFCISNSGGVHWAGNNGSFGLGGDEAYGTRYGGGGGGGGYMGGGGASGTTDSKNVSGGAGGSGYCNGSYGSCSGSSGVRSENGYAKITW